MKHWGTTKRPGVARSLVSCLEKMGVRIQALVAFDLAHCSRVPHPVLRQFAARPRYGLLEVQVLL